MIKVNSNFDEVAVKFNKYGKNVDKAVVSALNKTATQGRVFASKEVRKEYTVKSKYIKRGISVYKATKIKYSATITAKGKRLPLSQFSVSQNKRGTTIHVRRGHKKLLKHYFIATMQSGHKGVFVRFGEKRIPTKGKYAKTKIKRQPIVERYTLCVAQMFRASKVIKDLKRHVINRFPVILDERIAFYNR